MRLVPHVLVLGATVAILVGGCGSGPNPSASPNGSGAAIAASGSLPASTATAARSRAGSPLVVAVESPTGSGLTVAVEPGLLAFVPAQVDGLSLTFDPENTASTADDPALAIHVSGLAMGIVVATESSESTDLSVVSVARLRDRALDDSWFRAWRDTYDEEICSQAGGVVGHAQTTINGRTVFIGSCAGGVFTYIVRLDDAGVIVSDMSIGSRQLGLKVMEGIHP